MPRGRILSLFGRARDRAPSTETKPAPLPETVRDVIDSASVVFRHGTGANAGTDRAIVQIPGFNGFIYSTEAASKIIARAWPELDARQLAQAVRRLGQTVTTRRGQHRHDAAARLAVTEGTAPDTRPYLHRY